MPTVLTDTSGAGYQFGAQIVEKFLHVNDMVHILRAHQLCNEGYQVRAPVVWRRLIPGTVQWTIIHRVVCPELLLPVWEQSFDM
jgi:diadenosine tetraphosphatase ApaH/serine/threonine PP2A family protein phosphatase